MVTTHLTTIKRMWANKIRDTKLMGDQCKWFKLLSAHLCRSSGVGSHDCLSPCFSVLCELWFEMVFFHIAPYSVHPHQSGLPQGIFPTVIVVRKLYDSSDFWEGLFIDISGANLSKHITLGNIYRPPKLNNNDLSISTFIEEFAPILSKLGNEKSETIITGDFNIDLLKVNDRPKVGDYFDLFCKNGFYPKITLPTRFSRDSCTLIDQIFCKFSTATITSTAGILMSSISDHLPYFITINNMQSKIRMTPNLVQIRVNNESSIKRYCESVGQSRIIEQLDVNITANPNSNYNILDDILHELHEKHFPTKKVRFNQYKHKKSTWITMGIINSIKHKDKLYRILKQTCQNDESYNVSALNLRVYKNILNGAIRKAKCIHYAHLFDLYRTNMRKTWETIKQLLNKNHKQFEFPSTFTINGINISDKKEISQQFNNLFCKYRQSTG